MKNNTNNRKTVFWAVLSPLLAVLTVWAVLKTSKSVSVGDLVELTKSADKPMLFAAVLCAMLFILFEAEAVRSVLAHIGYKRGFCSGMLYSVSDFYFSAITPSATGGQPASAYFMMLDGIPGGVATASLILNLMMYTLSNVLLGIIAIILRPSAFTGFGGVSRTLIIAGFIALSLLGLFFLLILKNGTVIFDLLARFLSLLHKKKLIGKPERLLIRLDRAKEHYSGCIGLISGKQHVMLEVLFWNLLQRMSQTVVPTLLYLSLGGRAENAVMLSI